MSEISDQVRIRFSDDDVQTWSLDRFNEELCDQMLMTRWEPGEPEPGAVEALPLADALIRRIAPSARTVFGPELWTLRSSGTGVQLHAVRAYEINEFAGVHKCQISGQAIPRLNLILVSLCRTGSLVATALHEAAHIAQEELSRREVGALHRFLEGRDTRPKDGTRTEYADRWSEREARGFERWAQARAERETLASLADITTIDLVSYLLDLPLAVCPTGSRVLQNMYRGVIGERALQPWSRLRRTIAPRRTDL